MVLPKRLHILVDPLCVFMDNEFGNILTVSGWIPQGMWMRKGINRVPVASMAELRDVAGTRATYSPSTTSCTRSRTSSTERCEYIDLSLLKS
jgi:hypothetical protein